MLAHPPDHRSRNSFDPAGVLERLGQDRTHNDDHCDALDGASEALLEGIDEGLPIDPRDQGEQHDGYEQRDEDVPLEPSDEEKQQGDDGHQTADGDEDALGNHRGSIMRAVVDVNPRTMTW